MIKELPYDNPEEFIISQIDKISKETELKESLSLEYPNIQYSRSLIPERNKEQEILKIKKVEGLGTYLYYSSKGKIAFHEYILNIILKKLKLMKIKYKKGKTNYGEDVRIGNYYIELEINANPNKQLYKREKLINRIKKHPETTILILMNKQDKKQYKKFYNDIIYRNNRIFTIPEFLNWIKKENHK